MKIILMRDYPLFGASVVTGLRSLASERAFYAVQKRVKPLGFFLGLNDWTAYFFWTLNRVTTQHRFGRVRCEGKCAAKLKPTALNATGPMAVRPSSLRKQASLAGDTSGEGWDLSKGDGERAFNRNTPLNGQGRILSHDSGSRVINRTGNNKQEAT